MYSHDCPNQSVGAAHHTGDHRQNAVLIQHPYLTLRVVGIQK